MTVFVQDRNTFFCRCIYCFKLKVTLWQKKKKNLNTFTFLNYAASVLRQKKHICARPLDFYIPLAVSMWLFLEKIQMFACSNKVCACRKLSTFRYHVLFCCWFLIFDINCGVCWKDTFLFKAVLNILESSTPCSRAGTVSLFGSYGDSVKCLFAWFYVSLSQTLNSAVVSTLNILYEAKLLEIKKNEMKTASYPLSDSGVGKQLICWITVWEGSSLHFTYSFSINLL